MVLWTWADALLMRYTLREISTSPSTLHRCKLIVVMRQRHPNISLESPKDEQTLQTPPTMNTGFLANLGVGSTTSARSPGNECPRYVHEDSFRNVNHEDSGDAACCAGAGGQRRIACVGCRYAGARRSGAEGQPPRGVARRRRSAAALAPFGRRWAPLTAPAPRPRICVPGRARARRGPSCPPPRAARRSSSGGWSSCARCFGWRPAPLPPALVSGAGDSGVEAWDACALQGVRTVAKVPTHRRRDAQG